MNQSNYDSRMFGLSLQHQHTILGQRTGFPIRSIDKELNGIGAPAFFKYQLLGELLVVFFFSMLLYIAFVGTWGAIFFPAHWHAFLEWIKTVRLDDMQAGCTPSGLLSTQWWVERHLTGRMWTQWFIRFAFERGWYSLYTNFPDREAFAINYRESGLNFNTTRGPMNPLVEKLQAHVHFNFTTDPPIFDYHFTRLDQPTLLALRSHLWHRSHFVNQCSKIENNNDFKSTTKRKLIHSSLKQTVTTPSAMRRAKSVTHITRNAETRLAEDVPLLPSSVCLKWFLLFEIIFVFPISTSTILLVCLMRRKRATSRRKMHRKQ